jgi:very-short-patch-repair endonuclease
MTKSIRSYSSLSKIEKKDIIEDLYVKQQKSFGDIAELYDTYTNKVVRDAKAFGIKIRDKSSAQKNALSTGKHKHPTKGTTRDENTKQKIGYGVLKNWNDLSESDLETRKNKAKKQWENMSQDTKENMLKLANDAVRQTSKTGSKLEKYLLNKLLADGHKVEFHKEQTLLNTKLQIDLFLPSIDTAIEIDGPSHFLPVWGDDSLKRNITYDNKKEGLIIGKGWKLIRIKQTKDFSKTRGDLIYSELAKIITGLQDKNFSETSTFNIEDA